MGVYVCSIPWAFGPMAESLLLSTRDQSGAVFLVEIVGSFAATD